MKFIGIDCAANSGYAFLHGEHWEFGVIRADSIQTQDVLKWAKEHGVTHAAIEHPRPFGGSAISTYGSMSESYGQWLKACQIEGITAFPVLVNDWQRNVLVWAGQPVPKSYMNDDKYGSKFIASKNGCHGHNGDEADAVCIALYAPAAWAEMEHEAEMKRENARRKQREARAAKKKKNGN